MPNLNTREVLENMFNGTTAIKNQNPRFGQKEYYYINPYLDKQSSPTEKDIAYVDSPDDPNPFLQQQNSMSGLSPNMSTNNTVNNISTSTLSNSRVPRYWETSKEGEQVLNYVKQQEEDIVPNSQNPFSYTWSAIQAGKGILDNNDRLRPQNLSDKYKHALINCEASQYGSGGYDIARAMSWIKEKGDIWTNSNTPDSSQADDYANQIGRLLGTKYPNDNCEMLVQKYIQK